MLGICVALLKLGKVIDSGLISKTEGTALGVTSVLPDPHFHQELLDGTVQIHVPAYKNVNQDLKEN